MLTAYTTSKRWFTSHFSISIQLLHLQKSFNYELIPKIIEAMINYLLFHPQSWSLISTTAHDSCNFGLSYQSIAQYDTGNNIPVHQSKQSTEGISVTYVNDTGVDIYK